MGATDVFISDWDGGPLFKSGCVLLVRCSSARGINGVLPRDAHRPCLTSSSQMHRHHVTSTRALGKRHVNEMNDSKGERENSCFIVLWLFARENNLAPRMKVDIITQKTHMHTLPSVSLSLSLSHLSRPAPFFLDLPRISWRRCCQSIVGNVSCFTWSSLFVIRLRHSTRTWSCPFGSCLIVSSSILFSRSSSLPYHSIMANRATIMASFFSLPIISVFVFNFSRLGKKDNLTNQSIRHKTFCETIILARVQRSE